MKKQILILGTALLLLVSIASAYQICFESFYDQQQSCGAPPGAFDPCDNNNCNNHEPTSCAECDSKYFCVYDANGNGRIDSPEECFYAAYSSQGMSVANVDGNASEPHYAVCVPNPLGQGTWQDPDQCADSLGPVCGYGPDNKPANWGAATAEEDGIGEYDKYGRLTHNNIIQCCGDDFNESYNELNCRTKENITQWYYPGSRPYYYGKCCPSNRPFWNGTECTLYGCSDGDNLCIDPAFLAAADPDNNETACMQFQNYTCYNGDPDCCDTIDERGYIPDFSGWGTPTQPHCCGDDSGEFFASGPDGSHACCDTTDKCSIGSFCVPPGSFAYGNNMKHYCCFGSGQTAECVADVDVTNCNNDGDIDGSKCDVGESCTASGYTPTTIIDCDAYDYNDTTQILNSEPTQNTCVSGCADLDPSNCCNLTFEQKLCDGNYATDHFSNCDSYAAPPEKVSGLLNDFGGTTFWCHYNPADGWFISTEEQPTTTETDCNDGYDNDCDGTCDYGGCTAPNGAQLPRDSDCNACNVGNVTFCDATFCCGDDDGICPEKFKVGLSCAAAGGDPDC